MIRVTVMIWFDLENDENRFKEFETHMHGYEVQEMASAYSKMYRNGICKIFNNATEQVIARAGCE